LLEWLLDLDHVRLGRDAPLSLQWQLPVEPWVLATVGALAMLVVALLYRRESASTLRRFPLALIRIGLLALVLAVLCHPTLVLQRNRVEQSYVAVLVDESRSMAREETYADHALAQSVAVGAGLADVKTLQEQSRLDLVRRAFGARGAAPLQALLKHNAIQLYTFAGSARSEVLAGSVDELDGLIDRLRRAEPDGTATDLNNAVCEVIEDARGRRLAAIVLVSDGRSTAPADVTELSEKAVARLIPVYAVRIGSPTPVMDISVGPLRAEESVFVNDILAVNAKVSASGLAEATPVTVRLVDQRSGLSVAAQTVTLEPAGAATTIELRTKPTQPGLVRYRVEVSLLPDELTADNNVDTVEVTVLEDKLRVLYVDGYPRYEYRYLKNALVREPSMQISVLLLEADGQFVQEGTEPIRRFPESPEELNRYDVVLFGDVDPQAGWLSKEQMRMLLDFVGNEGGGFGLIAGERYTPRRFRGTPLAKLLPIRIDPGFTGRYASAIAQGFGPRLTRDGAASRVLRFADDVDMETARRVFDALPEIYWFAGTSGPKPGASVLVEHPSVRAGGGPMPLVVMGRYGSGKLFFQATDDTWRWRRHGGEFLHDTYWVRVARELMRPQRVGRDTRLTIRSDRRNYSYGDRVDVHVQVLDSELLAEQGDVMNVLLTDREDFPVLRFTVARLGEQANVFEGTCVPPRTGSFAAHVEGVTPRLGDKPASARFHVAPTDPESRRVEADHEILDRIAVATGGRMVDLDELEQAFATIPDRSVRIPDDISEPLWDSKLVLLLFALMITTEWVLRKAFGML